MAAPPEAAPPIYHTNYVVAEAPWSIHVVRLDRAAKEFQFYSSHARNGALGLGTVTQQIKGVPPEFGSVVAGINGDFYVRDKAYAGDPRGLQIRDGELLSAPVGGASFWIDAEGQAHTGEVASLFKVTWPDGSAMPFGLNEERRGDAKLVLYTPALGPSTLTTTGLELILEQEGNGPWLPLAIGASYTAKVREVRASANTPISSNLMVLSMGPALRKTLPEIQAGALLKISTETSPPLQRVKTAISGGPILVHEGRRQKYGTVPIEGLSEYATRSMKERHPRTAVGWDDRFYYLVEVDGRQKNLSVGMTLDELADFMIGIGCKEVMNFDGGGSAMIWYDGHIVNSPCDRRERPVANALLVVKKNGAADAAASRLPTSGSAAQ